jgi:hypothetical protein
MMTTNWNYSIANWTCNDSKLNLIEHSGHLNIIWWHIHNICAVLLWLILTLNSYVGAYIPTRNHECNGENWIKSACVFAYFAFDV